MYDFRLQYKVHFDITAENEESNSNNNFSILSCSTKGQRQQPFLTFGSLHRALVYVLGLAVGLFSLGALKIFELLFGPPDECAPDNTSPRLSGTSDFSTLSSGDHWMPPLHKDYLPMHTCPSTQSAPPNMYLNVPTDFLYPVYSPEHIPYGVIDPVSPTTDEGPSKSKVTWQRYPGDTAAGSIHTPPSTFAWTDAALNCFHFMHGVAQICVLCWFNSPEGWVFGPTLSSHDWTSHMRWDRLVLVEFPCVPPKGLRSAKAPVPTGIGLLALFLSPCGDAVPYVAHRVFTRLSPSPPNVTHEVRCPSKRDLSKERLISFDGNGLPVFPISPDHKLLPSEKSPPEYPSTSIHSLCNQDSLRLTSASPIPSRSRPSHKSPPLNSSHHPTFHTSDWRAAPEAIHPTWSLAYCSPRQRQISSSCLPVGETNLLRQSPSDSAECIDVQSHPNFPRATSNTYTTLPEDTDRLVHTSALPSTPQFPSSLEQDDLEYDEIYSEGHMNTPQNNSSSSSVSCSNSFRQEDEAQSLRLFETLLSLLDSRGVPTYSDGSPTRPSPHGSNSSTRCPNAGLPFTDLVKRAVDLSEDLNDLEQVLSRLQYKLAATKIGLDQAEDNLGYVWHLRDNLEITDTESITESYYGSQSSDSNAEAISERLPLTHYLPPTDEFTVPSSIGVSPSYDTGRVITCTTSFHLNPPPGTSVIPAHMFHSTVTSEADSGLDPFPSISSSMITSIPEEGSIMNRLESSNQSQAEPPFSSLRRLRKRRRRHTLHSCSTDAVDRIQSVTDEVTADSDGFVHSGKSLHVAAVNTGFRTRVCLHYPSPIVSSTVDMNDI
ncbi:unnamed protein product [Dicrocoelium dendriticum]|nr:unnamed protein product [Dicrocoelium dendriticum]